MTAEAPAKKKGGRPTKFNPARAERIISLIRLGVDHVVAAAAAGVDRVTLYRWLKGGAERRTKLLARFTRDVRIAEAEWEARMVTIVFRSATGSPGDKEKGVEPVAANPADARWALERKAVLRWGRRDSLSVDQKLSGRVTVNVRYDGDPSPDGEPDDEVDEDDDG